MPSNKNVQDLAAHRDAEGEAWQAEYGDKQGAHALPDFRVGVPEHVNREVFGKYVLDSRRNIVHRVHRSSPECEIDSIDRPVFIHFWHEAVRRAPDATNCPHCDWSDD